MVAEQSLFNMIEQQIRPWNVLDRTVLEVFEKIPRDEFVPNHYRALAFADFEIPLTKEAFMWSPRMEARVLQALTVQPHHRVLEIGSGSGFFTSLLAVLARHVTSLDLDRTLVDQAIGNLKDHGITNVHIECGDGIHGFEQHAPYHIIVQTVAVTHISEQLMRQLEVGGRGIAIVGQAPVQEVQLIERCSDQEYFHSSLFETNIAMLRIAKPEPVFVF